MKSAKRISPLSLMLMMALLLSAPRPLWAAGLEMFITIDGIAGESTTQAGAIDIESYSQELAVIVDARSKLPGRIAINDIWFTKHPDRATPGLLLYMTTGRIGKNAVIKARRAGTGSPYWQVELRNIAVTSLETGINGANGQGTEKVSLTFGQVVVTYTSTSGTSSSGGFDLAECVPKVEICDGEDNDCDGAIDENLEGDGDITSCGQGECAFTGIRSCENGQWIDTCVPGSPTDEVCDERDNDCDGDIDEGLTLDNDGDGHTNSGACAGTRDDCDDNDPNNFPLNMEVCDGRDNNCDGSIDENLEGEGEVTTCGQGECASTGVRSCENRQWIDTCVPGSSADEVCDGKDNDCNGQTDEGLTQDDDGDGHSTAPSCAGSRDDCDDSDPNNFPNNLDICDGRDNNCDGIIDRSPDCVCDLTLRAKAARTGTSAQVQLVWTHNGAPSYDIYRSTAGPNGPFVLLAAGYVSTYATYLDTTCKIGVTYWYRIGSDRCGAAAVSVTPSLSTLTR